MKVKLMVMTFLAGLGFGAALVIGMVLLISNGTMASGKVLVPLAFGSLIYIGYLVGLLRAEAKGE
ncbi:hypothetical protein LJC60_09590 [Ruminococcaceae bacterium OttesenSCG-928-D13]|nr:hypothetical protein [Ruminococcaceae bacterium OttesenSCG-928-D13]